MCDVFYLPSVFLSQINVITKIHNYTYNHNASEKQMILTLYSFMVWFIGKLCTVYIVCVLLEDHHCHLACTVFFLLWCKVNYLWHSWVTFWIFLTQIVQNENRPQRQKNTFDILHKKEISSNIHRASKETYHFFRATLAKIQSIKMNNIWTQISYSYLYYANLKN